MKLTTPPAPAWSAPVSPEQVDAFIAAVQALQDAYWLQVGYSHRAPRIVRATEKPTRYLRIAKAEEGVRNMSVYCFLDLTNGDLLKGSWKAPVKNGVRANIHDPAHMEAFDQYGPKYLR